MFILRKTVMAVGAILIGAAAGQAGDKEDRLIEKLVDAYGGEAFTDAKAIKITHRYKHIRHGQSASPDMLNIEFNIDRLTVDYENRRKSEETWNENRAGTSLTQVIHTDGIGYNIDHLRKTAAENRFLPYGVASGGTIRTDDTMLAKLLLESRDEAVRGEDVTYRGRKHATLTFPMEGSADLTLFIDTKSGLISKMERTGFFGSKLEYVFEKHRKVDGVTYASDFTFLINRQPVMITIDKTVDINPDLTGAFDVPAHYAAAGATIDTSEMIARDLGNGVYYAGKNGGFSIFVDAGDHFVAAGGYPELPDRLKAVQHLSGMDKPLGKQVITHHHSDHLGGMNEVVELGANFVTVAEHVQSIRDAVTSEVPVARFELVDGSASYAGGKMQVFDIRTVHSDNYLLVYVPSAKLVFSADHFGTNLETALPPANNNMVTLRQALETLDIDVQNFLGAHGARMLTMDDLRAVTDGYEQASCPAAFDICAD